MKNRRLNRMGGYDYSQAGCYFVTICAQDRVNHFGEIGSGLMNLSKPGKIVTAQWLWLPKQYDYVELDDYVVMPNHCMAS